MFNNLTGNENGLVGYWSFNDGDGQTLTDLTPNGNNGTVNGANWSDDFPLPPHTGPEWYVSEDGSDENNGSANYPFATIQKAINSANENDSIFVGSGTYFENINFNGKGVGLVSLDGPESTVIDGGQNGTSVVTFNNAETDAARLDGFTIANGYVSGDGGGIACLAGSNPIIRNCHITGNQADSDGGGMDIASSSPTIENCFF